MSKQGSLMPEEENRLPKKKKGWKKRRAERMVRVWYRLRNIGGPLGNWAHWGRYKDHATAEAAIRNKGDNFEFHIGDNPGEKCTCVECVFGALEE